MILLVHNKAHIHVNMIDLYVRISQLIALYFVRLCTYLLLLYSFYFITAEDEGTSLGIWNNASSSLIMFPLLMSQEMLADHVSIEALHGYAQCLINNNIFKISNICIDDHYVKLHVAAELQLLRAVKFFPYLLFTDIHFFVQSNLPMRSPLLSSHLY